MDPEQIFHSLRNKKPVMPEADCRALDLWECHPDDPTRVTDISLRWVHLDDGPELEAVLVTAAPSSFSGYAAFVFHKQGGWNLVGSFFSRSDDGSGLIRVDRLTADSPPLLLCYRYLGGSSGPLFMTEFFQLREGELWPVMQVENYNEWPYGDPGVIKQRVFTSKIEPSRLVFHTIREKPPGKTVQNKCEVLRWSAEKHTFVPVKEEQDQFCDPHTGKPIAGKSYPTGITTFP